MDYNKLVTIIVPTYNRPLLLQRTIESLVNQSYKNLEILVINDNGSPVEAIVDGFHDSRIKHYFNENNLGLAGTRNVGLQYMQGDYAVFCDDDDILLSYAIETRMYYMNKLKAEIVYTRALLDIWRPFEHGYFSVYKKLYWDSHFDRDLILIQNIAPCCCPLFSRKAWDKSDNYLMDTNMTTTEDHDFWIALSRKTDFYELKLVDCECSWREDKTQMTGKLNFLPNWIIVYKRWRHTAKDLNYVINGQRGALEKAGVDPDDYDL